MPFGKANPIRRTHVLDPAVKRQVEATRNKFASGEATVSLAEIVRIRRGRHSQEEQAIELPFIKYVISEYEQ
jgi:hypothetical protein